MAELYEQFEKFQAKGGGELEHDEFLLLLENLGEVECTLDQRGELAACLYNASARWGELDRVLFVLENILHQGHGEMFSKSTDLRYFCGIIHGIFGASEKAMTCYSKVLEEIEAQGGRTYMEFLVAMRMFQLAYNNYDEHQAKECVDRMFAIEVDEHIAYVTARKYLMRGQYVSRFKHDSVRAHADYAEALHYAKIHAKFKPQDQFMVDLVLSLQAWLLAKEGRFNELSHFACSYEWEQDSDRVYMELYHIMAHVGCGKKPFCTDAYAMTWARSERLMFLPVQQHLLSLKIWYGFVNHDHTLILEGLEQQVFLEVQQGKQSMVTRLAYLLHHLAMGECIHEVNEPPKSEQKDDYASDMIIMLLRWIYAREPEILTPLAHPLVRLCHEFVSRNASPLLLLGQRGDVLQLREGLVHNFSSRPHLLNMLHGIMRKGSDYQWSTGELFEMGWPDEKIIGENGFRRVYTELHRLKKLGVDVESSAQGYTFPRAIVRIQCT